MRQWLGLVGHPREMHRSGSSSCRGGLHLPPRQQQAAQLEVGPVGSPSLNPMASTLLEAFGSLDSLPPTSARLEMSPPLLGRQGPLVTPLSVRTFDNNLAQRSHCTAGDTYRER